MIDVTGMNQKRFTINDDHIEKIEEVPETLVTLVSGKKVMVKDTVDEVIDKVIDYKRKIHI